MKGPTWRITQITAEEAAKIPVQKRTGSLTIHFSEGRQCAYEWKEKERDNGVNQDSPVFPPKMSLTSQAAT